MSEIKPTIQEFINFSEFVNFIEVNNFEVSYSELQKGKQVEKENMITLDNNEMTLFVSPIFDITDANTVAVSVTKPQLKVENINPKASALVGRIIEIFGRYYGQIRYSK